MRRIAALLAALGVAACAAPPATSTVAAPVPAAPKVLPVALANAGVEEAQGASACPPQWTCRAHVNGNSFRMRAVEGAFEGKQALLIEYIGPEPWATVSQSLPVASLRGMRLRFSLHVKREGVTHVGSGAYVAVHYADGRLDHPHRFETGSNDWQPQAIEIDVGPGADLVEVGVQLEGKGRAWFDGARVEVLGPAAR